MYSTAAFVNHDSLRVFDLLDPYWVASSLVESDSPTIIAVKMSMEQLLSDEYAPKHKKQI